MKNNKNSPSLRQRARQRARQCGVALVFALIGLVVLTLGAVALIRSVDTGVLALGNLSFKQAALNAGARGADAAMDWLALNVGTAVLDNDVAAQGYYASSMVGLDPTARSAGTASVLALIDWESDGCLVNGQDSGSSACIQPSPVTPAVGGYSVRYVITRMCDMAGPYGGSGSTVRCIVPPIGTEIDNAGAGGGCGYKPCTGSPGASFNPYFRVITRTVGPKGTISYSETMAHF